MVTKNKVNYKWMKYKEEDNIKSGHSQTEWGYTLPIILRENNRERPKKNNIYIS